MKAFKTLEEMYNSEEFRSYISDKLGNNLFVNDPDRAARIHDAAEESVEGSTHQEIIDDWRDFLELLPINDPEDEDCTSDGITMEVYNNISAEIDAKEEWHEKNGSLEQSGC